MRTLQIGSATIILGDEPPSAELTVADFDQALTRHFDAIAKTKNYDNRITCALRAGYTGPYKTEGTKFAQWMDACNVYAYAQLLAWQTGARIAPVSLEAFIAELPEIVWA